MKSLSFAVLLVSLTAANLSLSQQKINSYEPPAEIKGTSLTLRFNSDFSSLKIDETALSNLDIYFSAGFQKWKFTKTNDLAISISPNLHISGYKVTGEPGRSDYSRSLNRFSADIDGAYAHYPVKDKFYFGMHNASHVLFYSESTPDFRTNIDPLIGYGRIVNAININAADNFENVLQTKGIISKPMDRKVKRLLTSLLDKRKSSEFRSIYRDNDEIEFYSAVEKVLTENGVINAPLGSRAVLRMYQALTNGNFLYFPKYRGFQLNAELNFTYDNKFADSVSKGFFHSVTLSAAYGLPVSERLSILTAAFIEVPVKNRYLEDYPLFSFHSPVIISESFQIRPSSTLDQIPYTIASHSALYSLRFCSYIKAFYDVSSTAGINFQCAVSTAKVLDGVYRASIDSELNFIYNIISKLQFGATTSFRMSYRRDYELYGGFSINYVLL